MNLSLKRAPYCIFGALGNAAGPFTDWWCVGFYLHNAACSMQKKWSIRFAFLISMQHWSAMSVLCGVVSPWKHFPTCMPASSCSQPIPKLPLLSLRVSLVGITWSPKEKPNQASTKLSASFVCTQNSAVEIPPPPLCLRLIVYRYLTTGNHDPGGCSGGSKVTPGALRWDATFLD